MIQNEEESSHGFKVRMKSESKGSKNLMEANEME